MEDHWVSENNQTFLLKVWRLHTLKVVSTAENCLFFSLNAMLLPCPGYSWIVNSPRKSKQKKISLSQSCMHIFKFFYKLLNCWQPRKSCKKNVSFPLILFTNWEQFSHSINSQLKCKTTRFHVENGKQKKTNVELLRVAEKKTKGPVCVRVFVCIAWLLKRPYAWQNFQFLLFGVLISWKKRNTLNIIGLDS